MVDAGADVNVSCGATVSFGTVFSSAKEFSGKTPLRMLGNEEVVKYLESVGAKTSKEIELRS
ncbi:MAG: hypothetical protein LBS00_00690 [Synergistaceae bacterium]|nr:hypothetical protein [Synergistaceae bacterium]